MGAVALQQESSYWQFCRKTSLQALGALTVGLASVLSLLQAVYGLGQVGTLLGTPTSSLEASLLALSQASRWSDWTRWESSTRSPAAPPAQRHSPDHSLQRCQMACLMYCELPATQTGLWLASTEPCPAAGQAP